MVQKAVLIILLLSIGSGTSSAQFGGPEPGQGPGTQGRRGGFGDSPPGMMEIRGRVVADRVANLDHPIPVRLEGLASELLDTAFTDGAGNFSFTVARAGGYYVAVTIEGFEPARERVTFVPIPNAAVMTNIILRSTAVVRTDARPATGGDDPRTVDLRQLEANIPNEARREYERALDDARRNNYRRAAERLEKAVALAPEFYDAYNSLGAAYTRLERYRDAESALARARELNPNGAQPLILLGSMHLQEGEARGAEGRGQDAWISFEKAGEVLERAVEANTFSAPARYYLGAALYRVAYYGRAEASLLRALELDPAFHDVRLMLSNVYAAQDRFDRSLEQLNLYLADNPRSPQRNNVQNMKRELERILEAQR